jgi:hypothetical protein
MLWIKDPLRWGKMSLVERLEALRKHYCTGPCGQSHSVLATRSATNIALKEAIMSINLWEPLDDTKRTT